MPANPNSAHEAPVPPQNGGARTKARPARGPEAHSRRWVIWSAVSSLPQAKEISLAEQSRRARDVVAQHGGVEVAALEVPGKSRSIVLFEEACARIDAYARLRDLLDARAFDVLVCLDRSRLGRTAALVMTVTALCEEAGVTVYEMDAPPASIGGRRSYADDLVGAIRAVGAEQEVRKFKERSVMGRIGRTRKGLMPGKIPYGYQKVFDPDSGEPRIVEDPATAPVVREIFRRYLAGQGTRPIAALLNERGVAPPGLAEHGAQQWTLHAVRKIIARCWTYAGFVQFDAQTAGETLREPGQHPPLIGEADAVRVEAEEGYRAGNRHQSRAHLLSGCCICAECGATMTVVSFAKPDNRKRRYTGYRCMAAHSPAPHGQRQASARAILPALRAAIEWLAHDADIDALLADEQAGDGAHLVEEVRQAEAALAAVKEQLFRLDELLVSGRLSGERHATQERRIGQEMARAEERLAAARQALARHTHRGDRRSRMEEVRADGLAMLEEPDITKANAWMRARVRILVRNGAAEAVHFI